MSNFQDLDYYKFQPQGDSPLDLSGREGAPRCPRCKSTNLDEDENCLDPDCVAEREADDAERLAFVGKLTEIMIAAGAQEIELPASDLAKSVTCATENCQDEVDPGNELCPACIRELKRHPNCEWSAQYK